MYLFVISSLYWISDNAYHITKGRKPSLVVANIIRKVVNSCIALLLEVRSLHAIILNETLEWHHMSGMMAQSTTRRFVLSLNGTKNNLPGQHYFSFEWEIPSLTGSNEESIFKSWFSNLCGSYVIVFTDYSTAKITVFVIVCVICKSSCTKKCSQASRQTNMISLMVSHLDLTRISWTCEDGSKPCHLCVTTCGPFY